MAVLLLKLVLLVAGQASAAQTYQHAECDFSFEYPNNWQIVKNADDVAEECVVTLRPATNSNGRGQQNAEINTLTVQVSELSFLQVAAESGFDFEGEWIVKGRQGSSDKAQIRDANGWLILRGVATVGCSSGGRTVLCSEHRVVAKQKEGHRVVAIVGGAQTENTLELLLKTLKLRPR